MVYLIGYKCPWDKFPTMRFLDGDPTNLEFAEDIGPITTALISARAKALAGFPIKSTNVPTKLLWSSRHEMPDFEGPPGFICVSTRMKDVIEKYERGVHQFFPVEVFNKQHDLIAERWLWVVCNRIDSVDREHTTLVLHKGAIWLSNWQEGDERVRIPDAKLFFSREQTDGYHFWRDKHLMGGGIYASDEAAEELDAIGLVGFAVGKREAV